MVIGPAVLTPPEQAALRRPRLGARLLSCLLLVGCARESQNVLEGSISEAGYSLDFEVVRITRTSAELVVRYEIEEVLEGGVLVVNQPVRLVVDVVSNVLKTEEKMDLPGAAVIEHNVIRLNDTGQEVNEPSFPLIRSGYLTFEAAGTEVGERVAGELQCVFENDRTLHAVFSKKLTAP
jgi:hypothetical protein